MRDQFVTSITVRYPQRSQRVIDVSTAFLHRFLSSLWNPLLDRSLDVIHVEISSYTIYFVYNFKKNFISVIYPHRNSKQW